MTSMKLERESMKPDLLRQWKMADEFDLSLVKESADGRMLFRVDSKQAAYALKIYPSAKAQAAVKKDIAILRFLANHHFPVPILYEPINGEGFGMINGRYAFLYQWVEGQHPSSTVSTFRKLGDLTGQLHCISTAYPYPSDFSPSREIRQCISFAEQEGVDKKYINLLLSLPDLGQFPQGIMHTDIGPHNVLESANHELIVVDWDDAGTGSMLLDISWLLEQCLSNTCIFDHAKARACLLAYQKHRQLIHQEITHIYDATLFFALLYWACPGGQKEFGRKRIDWLINHRKEFESVLIV